MENVKNIPTNKDEAAPVEQPQVPNHTEKIKSQVLAKIGKPPVWIVWRCPGTTTATTGSTFGSGPSPIGTSP